MRIAEADVAARYAEVEESIATCALGVQSCAAWIRCLFSGDDDCTMLASPDATKFLTALALLKQKCTEAQQFQVVCDKLSAKYLRLAKVTFLAYVAAMECFDQFAVGLGNFFASNGDDHSVLLTVLATAAKISTGPPAKRPRIDDASLGEQARLVDKSLLGLADIMLLCRGQDSMQANATLAGTEIAWPPLCVAPRLFAGACSLQRVMAVDPSQSAQDMVPFLTEIAQVDVCPHHTHTQVAFPLDRQHSGGMVVDFVELAGEFHKHGAQRSRLGFRS